MNLIMPEWPYDLPQYLLLNIAVGGYWGGQEGIDDTIFPQKMYANFHYNAKRSLLTWNIPHYVDTFEEEPEVDIAAVQNEISKLEEE